MLLLEMKNHWLLLKIKRRRDLFWHTIVEVILYGCLGLFLDFGETEHQGREQAVEQSCPSLGGKRRGREEREREREERERHIGCFFAFQ
jgi:hypothetical protein